MKFRAAYISFIVALLAVLAAVGVISASGPAIDRFVDSEDTLLMGGRINLPLVVRGEPKIQSLLNGDFEQGQVHWNEYSQQGWATILPAEYLPVTPRSGNWAAWLGGDYDEVNGIGQTIRISSSQPILTFYYWIASADICGYDVAMVTVDLEEVVDAYWLCNDNETYGWVRRTVDLTGYAEWEIELDILVGTDVTLNSNLFIDDVTLTGSIVALASQGDPQVPDVLKSTMISGLNPRSPSTSDRTGRGISYYELLQNYRDGFAMEEN